MARASAVSLSRRSKLFRTLKEKERRGTGAREVGERVNLRRTLCSVGEIKQWGKYSRWDINKINK